MEHPPTIYTLVPPDPPPFPSSPSTVDLSPLEFVLALLALITIPALIYTFLFSLKCPLFRRPHRHHSPPPSDIHHSPPPPPPPTKDNASDVRYKKEAHVKEIGTECPVCLSGFVDGEEVKQLSVCKHSFHASCIDKWLSSHDNCPVCRALVYVKRTSDSGNRNELSSRNRERDRDDHLQGLPDSSSLV